MVEINGIEIEFTKEGDWIFNDTKAVKRGSIKNKPICQYTMDGKLIATHRSLQYISRHTCFTSRGIGYLVRHTPNIKEGIVYERRSVNGCRWAYEGEELKPFKNPISKRAPYLNCEVLDLEGNLVKHFTTITAAQKFMGVSRRATTDHRLDPDWIYNEKYILVRHRDGR